MYLAKHSWHLQLDVQLLGFSGSYIGTRLVFIYYVITTFRDKNLPLKIYICIVHPKYLWKCFEMYVEEGGPALGAEQTQSPLGFLYSICINLNDDGDKLLVNMTDWHLTI